MWHIAIEERLPLGYTGVPAPPVAHQKEIGDKIVALTLMQAKELGDYL
jgi:hypothetical protein